jgi:hypothetical protein
MPTEIPVDEDTYQAILDFDALSKCDGTAAKWSSLKDYLREHLQIIPPGNDEVDGGGLRPRWPS